jgi:hypothetical protein
MARLTDFHRQHEPRFEAPQTQNYFRKNYIPELGVLGERCVPRQIGPKMYIFVRTEEAFASCA